MDEPGVLMVFCIIFLVVGSILTILGLVGQILVFVIVGVISVSIGFSFMIDSTHLEEFHKKKREIKVWGRKR